MANKFDINAQISRFDELVESEGFLGAIEQLWKENNLLSLHEAAFLYAIGLGVFLVVLFASGNVWYAFMRGILVAAICNVLWAIFKVARND